MNPSPALETPKEEKTTFDLAKTEKKAPPTLVPPVKPKAQHLQPL